jgi:hypothetical protein
MIVGCTPDAHRALLICQPMNGLWVRGYVTGLTTVIETVLLAVLLHHATTTATATATATRSQQTTHTRTHKQQPKPKRRRVAEGQERAGPGPKGRAAGYWCNRRRRRPARGAPQGPAVRRPVRPWGGRAARRWRQPSAAAASARG